MPVRIVQITDLHLMTDDKADIRGVRPRERFERVWATINTMVPDAERLVVTGDLTHDELPTTYAALKADFDPWWSRLRVIPGNHDDRGLMREAFQDRFNGLPDRNTFVDQVGGWTLIGLDGHVPGSLHGELGDAQRAWLEKQLAEMGNGPTALLLHHPPVSIHTPWLDQIRLADGELLLELVYRHPQIRLIGCGHVHQERSCAIGQALLVTTPSTGIQFRPETLSLEVDDVPPGFRIIDLYENGDIHTRVVRVPIDATPAT